MSDWLGVEFARPWWLVLLLLAVPWILWSRRRQPLPWAVGGLDPFRALAAKASRRRGLPLSLIAGLAALICAGLAAAGMRQPEQRPLWIVDGSYSFAAHPLSADAAWQPPAGPDVVQVGTRGDALPAAELLEAVRLEGAGRQVVVLTDLPEPPETPAQVDWRRQPRRGQNAAILDLWREGDRLKLRWVRWGGAGGALSLPGGGQTILVGGGQTIPLEGAGGLMELPMAAPGTRYTLLRPDGAALEDDQPQDDAWELAAPVRFLFPEEADSRWEDALRAAWPGCLPFRTGSSGAADTAGAAGAGGALEFRIRFGQAGSPFGFESDPFLALPELEAVAQIGRHLAAAYRSWHQARPWSECAPVSDPAGWEGRFPAPVAWRDASRGFGAVGLALYLLALALRRSGR